MIDVPTLSVPNARLSEPLADIGSRRSFESLLLEVAWFAHVGDVSEWDARAVRLHDWAEWPSAEDPGVLQLAEELQSIRAALTHTDDARVVDVNDAFTHGHDLAHGQARSSGVAYDPNQDAWHGPTQAVWDAAFVAGLVAGCFELQWPLPDDLVELWAWFQAGHWPCGYVDNGPAPRLLLVL